jgi:hypothetical protein
MSFSRGTKGEVLWSSCSADVMDKLNLPCLDEVSTPPAPENDHMTKYKNVPGTPLGIQGHYDNTYNYFTYNNFIYNNFIYNNFIYNDFAYQDFTYNDYL